MAYRSKTNQCINGYGMNGTDWCLQGWVAEPQLARANAFQKSDLRDRCPAGFHSYKMLCSSDYAKASTYRSKGSGDCNPGEIAEWGIWCTSDFAHMTANQIRSAAVRDWNNIYTATNGQKPKQSPDSDYSEVYTHMFGAPRVKGNTGAAAASDTGNTASQAEQAGKSGKPCNSEVGKAVGGLLGKRNLGAVLGSVAC